MTRDDLIDLLKNKARIMVSEDEVDKLLEDIRSILNYVDRIKSVHIPDDTPHHVLNKNVIREDQVEIYPGNMTGQEIINQAPRTKDGYIIVPRILDKENPAL